MLSDSEPRPTLPLPVHAVVKANTAKSNMIAFKSKYHVIIVFTLNVGAKVQNNFENIRYKEEKYDKRQVHSIQTHNAKKP